MCVRVCCSKTYVCVVSIVSNINTKHQLATTQSTYFWSHGCILCHLLVPHGSFALRFCRGYVRRPKLHVRHPQCTHLVSDIFTLLHVAVPALGRCPIKVHCLHTVLPQHSNPHTLVSQPSCLQTLLACVTDLHFELFQLWIGSPSAAVASEAAAQCHRNGKSPANATALANAACSASSASWASQGGLLRLLRPSGYSPNPLDATLAWHTMTTLQVCREERACMFRNIQTRLHQCVCVPALTP